MYNLSIVVNLYIYNCKGFIVEMGTAKLNARVPM